MNQTSSTTDTLLIGELIKLVEPIPTKFNMGPEGVKELLDSAGISEEVYEGNVQQIYDIVSADIQRTGQRLESAVISLVNETSGVTDINSLEDTSDVDWEIVFEDLDFAEVTGFVEISRSIYETIGLLDNIYIDSPVADSMADALFDYLLLRYLKKYHAGVYGLFCTLGIIVETGHDKPSEIHLSNLEHVISDPVGISKELFRWASTEDPFAGMVLIHYLKEGLWGLGLPSSITRASQEHLTKMADVESADKLNEERIMGAGYQLTVPLIGFGVSEGYSIEAGIKAVLVPPESRTDQLPGIALLSYGILEAGIMANLGNDWQLQIDGSGELSDRGVMVRPDSDTGLDLRGIDLNDTTDAQSTSDHDDKSLIWSLKLNYLGSNDIARQMLGTTVGTFEMRSFDLKTTFEYENDNFEFAVEISTQSRLTVDPQGGFLKSILPQPITYNFDATIGWSSYTGIFFENGGNLETSIPQHFDRELLSLREVYLAVLSSSTENGNMSGEDGGLNITAALSGDVELGPIVGSLKRFGISTEVIFPENNDGNFIVLDLDFGFKPPDGIGLSIDNGPVSGGGFLQFEPKKHRYSGNLELQFDDWSVKVVGLLKTELPGTDGYSLLLLVTGDLPPIQLGFGFVLNGIGGLAGIHRGFEKKPLGDAVRSGNLDSVLFPENVVENADQIITDLRRFFPPKTNRHVLGPMMRLGWGTPVIIRAELGVLVSIPDWKIALLGKFMLDLPDEEVGLIDINLAVVGMLDIPNKELAIDASLYDSRIASWTVSGDMAMRLSWGNDSRFMLSIGGFHPRYSPPTGFPELDRVKASLSPPDGNPRLEYTGYIAVTPNTFQVGAEVVLHGDFGPAVVHGELSFDALFRFNPFTFVVDFHAGMSVKISGHGLSLKLNGTLSGPQPYRVRGKLSIDILFISITVTVNAKFGPSGGKEEIPTANVLSELVSELKQPANWRAQKPADGHHLVTLRDPNADQEEDNNQPKSDVLLAHPLGTLGVRQQVVPLGVTIEKYGNAKPRHTTYELSTLTVAGSNDNLASQRQLKEKFAPARFKEMTDSEKLEAEPFERLPAGRTMENGIVHYAGSVDDSLLSWATLAYESSVIDEENDQYRLEASTVQQDFIVDTAGWDGKLGLAIGHELAEQSAVATAETRTTGTAAYTNPDTSKQISNNGQRYLVAWTDDLERVLFADNPAEGKTRIEAQEARDEYLATHDVSPDEVQVVGVQEVSEGSGGDGL